MVRMQEWSMDRVQFCWLDQDDCGVLVSLSRERLGRSTVKIWRDYVEGKELQGKRVWPFGPLLSLLFYPDLRLKVILMMLYEQRRTFRVFYPLSLLYRRSDLGYSFFGFMLGLSQEEVEELEEGLKEKVRIDRLLLGPLAQRENASKQYGIKMACVATELLSLSPAVAFSVSPSSVFYRGARRWTQEREVFERHSYELQECEGKVEFRNNGELVLSILGSDIENYGEMVRFFGQKSGTGIGERSS